MTILLVKNPPTSEAELIDYYQQIAGLSFCQLAASLGLVIPEHAVQRKGWAGQAIELVLGASAQNHAKPDFPELGIELKTLPIGTSGKTVESTFITSIPLQTIHQQKWSTSQCYSKIKRILWVPIEGDKDIPFHQRRIGLGFIWSPDAQQEKTLEADWTYLTCMIATGKLEEISAHHGDYLQIRPKAANAKSLSDAYDSYGNKIKTLPRGFYLRSRFTSEIYSKHFVID